MRKPHIILASGSPYRRQQLQQLGITCEHFSPAIDETPNPAESAADLALRLAIAKSRAPLPDTCNQHNKQRQLVIGGDQTAEVNGIILGKPGNHTQACKQLSLCSGQTVIFYSALALHNTNNHQTTTSNIITRVTFRTLHHDEITHYLHHDQPYDCAGSFKIEGLGTALFDAVTSDDPSALIGLPLIALNKLLMEQGVNLLSLTSQHPL